MGENMQMDSRPRVGFWLLFLAVVCGLQLSSAQNLELPKLPYDYADLEPAMDAETMTIHHMGHHAAYLTTVNKALDALRENPDTKYLAKMGLDKLLQNLDKIPQPLDAAIRNGGGGFVNHILFWNSMTKNGTALEPDSHLMKAIDKDLGGIAQFEAIFKDKAAKHFGSGWVWLVWKEGVLSVETTPNQNTPAMTPGNVPLLGLDLWEHAYYLKYRNKRVDYIQSFWTIIDWRAVSSRFLEAGKKSKGEL